MLEFQIVDVGTAGPDALETNGLQRTYGGDHVFDVGHLRACDFGEFFVYLEDVDQHGVVRYLTEGEMRAINRKNTTQQPLYAVIGPYHSFRREDAEPLTPGRVTAVTFSMMPISVLIRAGHRIRIAVAGADADTFQRIPEMGVTVFHIYGDGSHPSHVVLPMVEP